MRSTSVHERFAGPGQPSTWALPRARTTELVSLFANDLTPVVEPIAVVIDQLTVRLPLHIVQFTEGHSDDLALKSSLTENAVLIVNHRLLVRIAEANDLDSLRVAVLGTAVGLKRKDQVFRQIAMVGFERVVVHGGQRVVAGQFEYHPDAVVLVFRRQRLRGDLGGLFDIERATGVRFEIVAGQYVFFCIETIDLATFQEDRMDRLQCLLAPANGEGVDP